MKIKQKLSHYFSFSMLLAILLGMGFTTSIWAIDLHSAKSQGLVGEQPSGYLGSVNSNPSADVADLIKEINSARKSEYEKIAKRNNTQLDVVEKLAGKKAIEKTPAGQYIQLPSGQWTKK